MDLLTSISMKTTEKGERQQLEVYVNSNKRNDATLIKLHYFYIVVVTISI